MRVVTCEKAFNCEEREEESRRATNRGDPGNPQPQSAQRDAEVPLGADLEWRR